MNVCLHVSTIGQLWGPASIIMMLQFLMPTDYPSSASVQQPQSPPIVQTQSDVCSQSPKNMSYKQLAVWLGNHPSLSGGDYEDDISKLRGTLPDTVVIIMILINTTLFRCQN